MTDREQRRTRAREFDLVLFGATGFTGRLVAEYLVKKRPSLRWALAGRSRERLERVREELAALEPSAKELPLVVGDSLDKAAMEGLASRTRVVCTTAGPYARYGSVLLGACAEQGTDYCDLTGETQWVREMIDAHHARAVETGARIVPSCGFDSIPSDLGVLLLHEQLAAKGGRLAEAHYRLRRMKGGASGGTIASGLHAAEQMGDPAVRQVFADPFSLSPEGAPDRRGHEDWLRPRRDPETGRWLAPFFMAPVNTRVVRRSNALSGYAYGREFRYDEAIDVGRGLAGLARAAAASAGMALSGAVVFGPVRKLAERFLPAPGEGPSREERESGFFDIELLGVGTAGERVRARVGAKQDPGYGATSWMLGESALCLAEDELPERGGLLTPASCMGMKLVERLRAAGMTFQAEAT
ncbi:saccharopine dehydrogenase NADP-binding domain-containing protein [Archangium violaceum]|uniref:saccharopine dehydrogenase family protein n=1 Tax=Archangium violaceum TaxID=83451 RepID=UPI002B2DB0CC|nr:saccharopine dehydrogenase NADP-binding domain-containing protein [Archangium gephyra]